MNKRAFVKLKNLLSLIVDISSIGAHTDPLIRHMEKGRVLSPVEYETLRHDLLKAQDQVQRALELLESAD